MFVKAYCAPSVVDEILRSPVAAWLDEMGANRINRWFFVRYADPEWHIRIRFEPNQDVDPYAALSAFCRCLRDFERSGKIWRVQIDTYEKETSRYGGVNGMDLCESLFHIDSEAVLRLIVMSSTEELAKNRWAFALLGMRDLLESTAWTSEQKRQVVDHVAESFRREILRGGRMTDRLKQKKRELRDAADRWLLNEHFAREAASPVAEIFEVRRTRMLPLLTKLCAMEEADPGQPVRAVESLLHMHANRMFVSAARAQEMVTYNLLHQYLRSRDGRKKEEVG